MTDQSNNSKRELLRRLLHERMANPPEPRGHKSLGASSPIEMGPPLERVPRTDDLELSFGQEMIWLQDQMIPEVMFYNVVERFGVKGRLDVELLRRCIDEVTKRHEILRTIYPIVAGWPVQRVEPPHPCSLRVFDLRKCPTQDREGEARRLIAANVKTRFDLERDAVLRPLLLQLGDEEFIFAVVVHHIAIDGWSLRLFIHEITTFYSAFLEGRKPQLHRITVQYVDFARWQRRWMTGDVLARHRDYWRDKLGTSPPLLNLRSDFTPGSIRTFNSSVFHVTINSDTLERLKEISRRAGATLFAVLLGAFATLLMRYSEQEDFIVGSIMSARVRPEVDNLLGFFGNLLALRIDLSGNPTFNELVSRMREIVFEAHEHGAYPFQRLVEVMQPKRSANSNPFVQSLVEHAQFVGPGRSLFAEPFDPPPRWARCAYADGCLDALCIRELAATDSLFLQYRAVQIYHDRAYGEGYAQFAQIGFGLRTNADLGFTDGRSADGSSEGCRRGHFG